jgi:HK97 family phage prohead protease
MSNHYPDGHSFYRMVPTDPAEMRVDGDDGNTLVGYPIVFNAWAEINGWEGRFLERIAPGAVTKTLKDRGGEVKVLYDHGFDPQIGNKPLGKPSLMEPRDRGLYIEVPLDDTSYNRDLKASLKSGAIDGMSFRFTVTREDTELPDDPTDHNPDRLEERTIRELKLFEVGPVTWPAYEATTAGVRSREEYADRRRLADYNEIVDAAPPGTSTVDTPHIVHLSQQDIDRLRRRIAQTDRRSRR